MNVQVLTDVPGGYVTVDPSQVVGAGRWRTCDAVQVRFWNGDYVIVSGETARDLGRLGVLRPSGLTANAWKNPRRRIKPARAGNQCSLGR